MEETTRNEELNNQILESLERINQNTVQTNNALDDLQEYLIIKDQEEEEKENKEKENSTKAEEKDKQEAEEVAEQETATSEATYEVLVQIRDEQRLTNQMFAGYFLITGIICGVLLFKILWDKLT